MIVGVALVGIGLLFAMYEQMVVKQKIEERRRDNVSTHIRQE